MASFFSAQRIRTNRGVVPWKFHLFFEIPDIEIHLTDVLMGQLADLQIDENKAFQDIVVKNKIDVKMVAIYGNSFLAGHKRKTLAKFKKKIVQLVDQTLFQFVFKICFVLLQAEKFQYIGISNNVVRPRSRFELPYLSPDTPFIPGWKGASHSRRN